MVKKPFTYDEFKAIYSKVPRISVDLVIPHEGGIALIERALASYEGQWHLPGGTVYYKEPLEAAVKRIGKEETGLDLAMGDLLGYIEYHSEEEERGFGYTIGLVFTCKRLGGSVTLDEGGSAIRGFSEIPDNTVVDQQAFLRKLDLDRIISELAYGVTKHAAL